MGIKNDESIKMRVLVVGAVTPVMRHLCYVIREEESARNDILFTKPGSEVNY